MVKLFYRVQSLLLRCLYVLVIHLRNEISYGIQTKFSPAFFNKLIKD